MIHLQPNNKTSIYQQVKDALIFYITNNVYQPHDLLPSIRQMASDLAINPNTVSKAYKELEQEGYIYSVVGKGSYVSDITTIKSLNLEKVNQQLNEVLHLCLNSGIDQETVMKMVKEVYHD